MKLFSRNPIIRFIKKLLPKTLLGRALMILITPLILVQVTTGFVFWDRHWTKFTEKVADQIAAQVLSVVDLTEHDPLLAQHPELMQQHVKQYFYMSLKTYERHRGFDTALLKKDRWREKFLTAALSAKTSLPFRVRVFKELIQIQVASDTRIYDFQLNKKILFPRSTPIVIWWEIGAPIFFLMIAIVFMKNQVKPMRVLADAVEEFGKGRDVPPLKPVGALEVRRVTRAFNDMRDRIQRQITQRTEMLAGISHDLKTPLTRMELQLALMKESPAVHALQDDLKEMEQLVEEYLAFARGEEGETLSEQDLTTLLREIIEKMPRQQITFTEPDSAIVTLLRPFSIRRALKNVLNNALRYGHHAWVHLSASPKTITVIVDDDGPGIPIDRRDDVFRPFVRLDASRNKKTGGYGLGLSITKDMITSHGGHIFLKDSPRGGLRVVINLPV